MKPRPIDECLAASSQIIATTRSKLAQMQISLDTCLARIEISADAIAASQALLAKLDGSAAGTMDGAEPDTLPAAEKISDSSDGAAPPV